MEGNELQPYDKLTTRELKALSRRLEDQIKDLRQNQSNIQSELRHRRRTEPVIDHTLPRSALRPDRLRFQSHQASGEPDAAALRSYAAESRRYGIRMGLALAGAMALSVLVLCIWAAATSRAESVTKPPVTPIIHAHAHNDYEHVHPLFDAMDNGFTSVEADVHLIDGKLLVAHNRLQTRADRTLESLYLDPLKRRIEAHGGRVYRDGPSVVLLIDVKTPFAETFPAIEAALKPYGPLLATWHDDKPTEGAITVIITGNRNQSQIAAERDRDVQCDGELQDLQANPPAELVPWISTQWTRTFKWDGKGPIPPDELEHLRQIVRTCHEQHRKLRFWGSPDFPAFWAVLRDNDVDLINTDHLPECRKFLLERGGEAK